MVPARKTTEMTAEDLSIGELMLRFEALGSDCQFGSVQRFCGIEPLGLFRFMSSKIDNLVAVIETRLAGFMTPDDLAISMRGGEHMLFSRRYDDFAAHTGARLATQDAETVAERQRAKAAYLKTRFLIDWEAAERIYVHCGCDDEVALRRLHAALRRRSDCWLLWVTVASRPEDRGRIELLAPGLLKGHLAHHGTFEHGGFRTDLRGWAMVCRAADAAARGLPAPPLRDAPAVAARFAWASAINGTVSAGATVGRCRLLHDALHVAPAAQLTVTASFARKAYAVASVWVRLPASFTGHAIGLTCADAFPVGFHPSDPTVVGTWQQVWLVMRMGEDQDRLRLSFEVAASRGSEFEFGGWQVQLGSIPAEDLRPDEGVHGPQVEAVAPPTVEIPPPRPLALRLASWLRRAAGRLDPPPVAGRPTENSIIFDILTLSNVLMDSGRFDEADAVIAAGKSLYPWRADLYSHHALSADRRKHLPMAVERWTEVIEGFPQYAFAHYRLAATWRELGEPGRALAVIEAALPRHLDDPGMVSEAARVYATMRRWPDALAAWDRAIALSGETPEWRAARAHAARMAAKMAARSVPAADAEVSPG